jgi:Na+-transporting NADH:ubiquinone oxidoreductase subunit NqrC
MVETSQNSKQKRNKIILFVVIGLSVFCLVVCGVAYISLRQAAANIVKMDPEEGKNLASQITDYDLPSGYKEIGGTTLFGLVTAAISDEKNDQNTIWLVQAPSDNLPTPEKFLRDGIAYQSNNPITWTAEDVEVYMIRGEKTSITIYKGIAQDNQMYYAWTGNFKGKGGPALIVIVGPAEAWNENVAETFINSMR